MKLFLTVGSVIDDTKDVLAGGHVHMADTSVSELCSSTGILLRP